MIDFVILWVDGSDPEWLSEFKKYSGEKGDKAVSRFRDWDNLQYWFRGVEKFAPWVDKIHFVTWGHLPKWLNRNHPKLSIIKHSDFIPKEYLPTFNSHTIELNLHRITTLNEKFVYFNDDHFLIRPLSKSRFFRNGLPCDMAVLNAIQPNDEGIDNIILNNIKIINRHFNKRRILKTNWQKWFSLRYKKELYRTIALYPWSLFTGFLDPHMPNAYTKSLFSKVWNEEFETLNQTCLCRFRNSSNINQYLLRYWRLCEGNFEPINIFDDSHFFQLQNENLISSCRDIENLKYSIIGLTDVEKGIDFNKARIQINSILDSLLPQKSSFEL